MKKFLLTLLLLGTFLTPLSAQSPCTLPQPSGYVCIPGYWTWTGSQYIWVNGYWTPPPLYPYPYPYFNYGFTFHPRYAYPTYRVGPPPIRNGGGGRHR